MPIRAIPQDLKALFEYPRLSFPAYQRNFVWADKAKGLLDDLYNEWEAYERGEGDEEKYFIGNLLFVLDNKSEATTPDVADGQQRLTTFFITLSLLSDKLRGYASEPCLKLARDCRNLLIKSPDLDTEESYLRSLRPAVNEFLLSFARKGSAADVYTRKNQPDELIRPYLKVCRTVAGWVNDKLEAEKDCRSFTRFILLRVEAVVIIYPNASSALYAFERLNAGGDSLVPSDLLKSEFMKGVPPEKWPNIDAQWEKIITGIPAGKGELTGFLRKAAMAMVCTKKDIPTASNLLRKIQAETRKGGSAGAAVLEKISLFSNAVRGFMSDTPQYLAGDTGKVLSRLRRLPSNAEFVRAMVGCIPEHLDLTTREDVCRAIEALACHVGVAKKAKNVNYKVQPFCVELRDLKTSEEARDFCKRLHAELTLPLSRVFEDSVHAMRVQRSSDMDGKWAKYLLHVVEQHIRAGLGDTDLPFDKEHLEIEHILAQALSEQFPESAIYSLGNCTLLEKTLNSSGGKKSFQEKKGLYPTSIVRMTRELAGLNHGSSTTGSKFLAQAEISATVHYPAFEELHVALRLAGILAVLRRYWGLGNYLPVTVAETDKAAAPEAILPLCSPEPPSQVQDKLEPSESILLGVTTSFPFDQQPAALLSQDTVPAHQLIVRQADGQGIYGKNAAEILVKTLMSLGLARIEAVQPTLRLDGTALVSRNPLPQGRRGKFIDGFYISTHSDTKAKAKALENVSAALDANLQVQIAPPS